MKKTKQLALSAMLAAMYFVLSAILKIPVAGHITLDLGYIALTVAAVYLGAVPAALVGAVGAFLSSALMTQRGVSPGWITMNLIAGFACGLVLHKTVDGNRKTFLLSALAVVPSSMLVGAAAKLFIDCAMYSLPVLLKIPTTAVAWLCDSLVMLAAGLPLCLALKKRL